MSKDKLKLELSEDEKTYIEIMSFAQSKYAELLAKIANSMATKTDEQQQSGIK